MSAPAVVRGPGSLRELCPYLRAAGHRRGLVLCGPSRRHVPQLAEICDGIELEVFDGARVHVPSEVVERADARLREVEPDFIVSIGGGAATGLGKMLRRVHGVVFVAVPTTYSGSEMTEVWGTTEGGDKRTGRDARVRPDLVVHDAELFVGMPASLAVPSALNALAHPISALSTGALDPPTARMAQDAIARLYPAVAGLGDGRAELDTHDRMLAGTELSGRVIDTGGLGVHHRVAHLLGGRTGLPHSGLHSVLLPHSTAALRTQPQTWAVLVRATGDGQPDMGIHAMLVAAGVPTGLAALGLSQQELDEAGDALRALGPGVEAWVQAAFTGDPPQR